MQIEKENGERIAKNVSADMRAEGFRVSSSTQWACLAIAVGKASADQLVKARISAHISKKS